MGGRLPGSVTIHSATPSPPESIKIGSGGGSHFNASLTARGKVTRRVSIHNNFRREWRAESGKSTRTNRLMSRDPRRDPEIPGEIPRFQEISRDLRRDPEISGEIPRFQERSRGSSRDPEISRKIPRFQARSRDLRRDPKVPGEILRS